MLSRDREIDRVGFPCFLNRRLGWSDPVLLQPKERKMPKRALQHSTLLCLLKESPKTLRCHFSNPPCSSTLRSERNHLARQQMMQMESHWWTNHLSQVELKKKFIDNTGSYSLFKISFGIGFATTRMGTSSSHWINFIGEIQFYGSWFELRKERKEVKFSGPNRSLPPHAFY